jgi:hypothetical protein
MSEDWQKQYIMGEVVKLLNAENPELKAEVIEVDCIHTIRLAFPNRELFVHWGYHIPRGGQWCGYLSPDSDPREDAEDMVIAELDYHCQNPEEIKEMILAANMGWLYFLSAGIKRNHDYW